MNEKMGVDPKIKESINKDGWEENAAVVIGKKGEELDGLLHNLENDGRCENVVTFVRMNKKIIVPVEEIKKPLEAKPGTAWIVNTKLLFFIDKNGNIAKVKFDYPEIATTRKLYDENPKEEYGKLCKKFRGAAIRELEEVGFNFFDKANFDNLSEFGGLKSNSFSEIQREIVNFEKEKEKKALDRRLEGFDF